MSSTCISGNASVVASKFWFINLGFCMINTRTGYIETSFIILACVYSYISCLFTVMHSDTTLTAQSCRWSVHLMLGSKNIRLGSVFGLPLAVDWVLFPCTHYQEVLKQKVIENFWMSISLTMGWLKWCAYSI